MGNFRGAADEAHTNPAIASKEFWNFTLNEHAFRDLPAFIGKIREIKAAELARAWSLLVIPRCSMLTHTQSEATRAADICHRTQRMQPIFPARQFGLTNLV